MATLDQIIGSEPIKSEVVKQEVDIEKLAEVLDAMAKEDTLIDDLARAAVVMDMIEGRYGKKRNA